LVYESTTDKGFKIEIYKKSSIPLTNLTIQLPKWILTLLAMFIFLLSIILLAAIVIVLKASRPGQYLESCDGRSCQSGLSLKCIDKVCKCESNKYFEKGCVKKKLNGEFCSYSYECSENLYCTNGKCQCNQTKYWSDKSCINRYSYGEFCEEGQCLSTVMLSCIDGMCQCDETRFWNNVGCISKRGRRERCFDDG
jgi:hypothetical protein